MTVISGHCHLCNERGILYPAKKNKENIKICWACRERVKAFQSVKNTIDISTSSMLK